MLSIAKRVARGGLMALAIAGLGFVGLAYGGSAGSTAPNSEDDYRLGPQDKVQIRVFEWRASRDEVFEWKAINAEYIVSASGRISIPLLGEISAAGLAPHDLATTIGLGLKNKIGLVESPDVSVEVVQYRPFYIVGEVDKPGEYPYRPGITLLQAVSLAGGDRRNPEIEKTRLEREVIVANGDLTLLELQLNSLRARKARIAAELADSEEIKFPDELTHDTSPSTALLLDQENLIFRARREAQRNALNATTQLKDYLDKEIVSLQAQLATQDTQLSLANEELDSVVDLYQRGLAPAPRKLSLQRDVAQLQGDRLRLEASLIKARQDSSAAGLAIIELNNKRMNDLTSEMRSTQASLDEAIGKTDTTKELIYESTKLAPRLTGAATGKLAVKPVYTIVRRTGPQLIEIAAEESSVLEAGDTVKVELVQQSGDVATAVQDPAVPANEQKLSSGSGDEAKPPSPITPSKSIIQLERSVRAGY